MYMNPRAGTIKHNGCLTGGICWCVFTVVKNTGLACGEPVHQGVKHCPSHRMSIPQTHRNTGLGPPEYKDQSIISFVLLEGWLQSRMEGTELYIKMKANQSSQPPTFLHAQYTLCSAFARCLSKYPGDGLTFPVWSYRS